MRKVRDILLLCCSVFFLWMAKNDNHNRATCIILVLLMMYFSRYLWFTFLYKKYLMIYFNITGSNSIIVRWDAIWINGKEVCKKSIDKKLGVTKNELARYFFSKLSNKGDYYLIELECAIDWRENEYEVSIICTSETKGEYDKNGFKVRESKYLSVSGVTINYYY